MKLGDLIPKRKVGLGIDIRGGMLCHALLRRGLAGVELLDWGIEELPREPEMRDAAIKEKLSGIMGRLPARPAFITVGLPRSLVTMRSVTMPAVGEEELRGILEYEVERHIPFPPEEVEYHFQAVEKGAEKATLLLAAARKEEIARFLSLLSEAGIKPTGLGVSTFASFNALLYNQGKRGFPVTALIDLRNGEAEIGVAMGKVLQYSRCLPLGPALTPEALLPELAGLLAHLGPGRATTGAGRISVAGTGGGRGDLLHHLAERTGLEAEYLRPFERIRARGVDPQAAQALGAAVGLALTGLVDLPLRIDLLPKEAVPWKRDPTLTTTIRLVALIALLGLAYLISQGLRERRALADLNARLAAVKAEAEKVEQLKGEVARMVGQVTALQKVDQLEVRKLDLLREVLQVLPKTVTLTLFSVEGREMRIGGSITGSASDLISILEQSPLIENVQFTSPVATRGGETQDFQIKAFIEPQKVPQS